MVDRTPTSLLIEPQTPHWAQRLVLRIQTVIQGLQDQLDALSGVSFPGRTATGLQRGALVTRGTVFTGNFTTSASFGAYVPWDAETYDTDNIFNPANNLRLTIPPGAKQIRVLACISIGNITANDWVYLAIDYFTPAGVNTTYVGKVQQAAALNNTAVRLNGVSPVFAAVPGNYFQLRIFNSSDTSIDLQPAETWFALEVVA